MMPTRKACSAVGGGQRLSGLQKDVLSLYRKVLRETLDKDRRNALGGASHANHDTVDNDAARPTLPSVASLLLKTRHAHAVTTLGEDAQTSTSFAAAEFRRQAASVARNDYKRIEYMIRKGEKQIKLLRMPGVKLVQGSAGKSASGSGR